MKIQCLVIFFFIFFLSCKEYNDSDLYPVMLEGKEGFIDKNGKIVITLPEGFRTTGIFSEGLSRVQISKRIKDNNPESISGYTTKFTNGYINISGEIIISGPFIQTRDFSNGLAPVEIDEKWGYIEKSGKLKIKNIYDFANEFSDNMGRVYLDKKVGFVDDTGKQTIKPEYEELLDFSQGLAAVKIKSKWGFINKKFEIVIKPKYDKVMNFSEGLAKVELNKKFGYIDKQGKEIIPTIYEDVATYFNEGLAAVKIKNKWGFINKENQIIINPQFDDNFYPNDNDPCRSVSIYYCFHFTNSLAAVPLNSKWGYIDKKGDFVIKPKFNYAQNFKGELAAVEIEHNIRYINKLGVLVSEYTWSVY
jgi:hypothetical protein